MSSRPVAACVVLIRDSSVLAISRRDDHTSYGLPGGLIQPGELPSAAAARKLEEETGLFIDEGELTLIYEGVDSKGKLVATFYAPDPGGSIRQSDRGVVVWGGWLTLTSGPYAGYNTAVRAALVNLPEHWVATWGSGTLRRCIEEGLAWRELYLHERVAFEFGYSFSPVPRSRIVLGRALAEGDSPAVTETCWWARSLRWRAERDQRPAKVEVIHARVSDGDGGHEEGVAITYEPKAQPAWLPKDRVMIAFTTNSKGTVNPC